LNRRWSQPGAETYTPDGQDLDVALDKITHLAVGAHQDDLEIMAIHGILECFNHAERSFSGVVVTSGQGSARSGKYAAFSDQLMAATRKEEQRAAARLGRYGSLLQLDFESAHIKQATGQKELVSDLCSLLSGVKPDVLYTHSLFDAHATHVATSWAVVAALRLLPAERVPRQVVGCEVWQDLDWLPQAHKIIMDVSAEAELQVQLLAQFQSQISGGKRYDLAALGRRRAHATFSDSHHVDHSSGLVYGMDLLPLVRDPLLKPGEYLAFLIKQFEEQSLGRLSALFPPE